jgi:predicted DNA binding CopG/RHH family protein
MTERNWEALLERDWSDDWESLPEAPEWAPRAKDAQITLRLPTNVLVRVKKVAAARSLPYHALARSWITDGLRGSVPRPETSSDEPQADQLNIKLDQESLDELKERAHQVGSPYHRLAREWIESALTQEEKNLGLDAATSQGPALMDVMLLLLHAPNRRGEDAVRGITRLQKLLFVIEQKLSTDMGFYAYNFGPFNEDVNDAAEALRLAGFLQGGAAVSAKPPTFEEMMAAVVTRAGPSDRGAEIFALNDDGHDRAERLKRSSRAYEQLYAYVAGLRKEWDTPEIVERVYEEFPKYTEKSLIRDDVLRRRKRR